MIFIIWGMDIAGYIIVSVVTLASIYLFINSTKCFEKKHRFLLEQNNLMSLWMSHSNDTFKNTDHSFTIQTIRVFECEMILYEWLTKSFKNADAFRMEILVSCS